MSDIESYLILKYGTIHRAYNIWMNTQDQMDPELSLQINLFFRDYFLGQR